MLKLLMKLGLAAALLAAAALPAGAAQFGACNHRLNADIVGADGVDNVPAAYLDCDVDGQLVLDGKTYKIFEYSTSGSGRISLGAMLPGIDADEDDFESAFSIAIVGEHTDFATKLADSTHFTFSLDKDTVDNESDEDAPEIIFPTRTLTGHCARYYNDKNASTPHRLESCRGKNWSLEVNVPGDDK